MMKKTKKSDKKEDKKPKLFSKKGRMNAAKKALRGSY
tara:strand:- start:215 stop:325 length:111 start_codon:yes stop_codon:yes gene_type:complete